MSFCVLSNHCWLTKEVAIVFMSSREADVLRVVGFHIRWWHLWCINIEDRHHTHAHRGHLRPAGGRPDRANKARFFRYFVCQRVVVGGTQTEELRRWWTNHSIEHPTLCIGSLSYWSLFSRIGIFSSAFTSLKSMSGMRNPFKWCK